MKAKHLVTIIVSLVAILSLVAGCGGSGTQSPSGSKAPAGYEKITLVGNSIGSGGTMAVTVMAKLLNKYYPEIEWASRAGASGVNPIQVTDGTIKIGTTNPSGYVEAFKQGNESQSRLRSLSIPLAEINYNFIIPADKPWTDITQVPKGLTVNAGSPGGTTPGLCETWLKLAGLTKKDFNWLELGKDAFVEGWRSGKVDFGFPSIQGAESMVYDLATTNRKPKAMGLSPEQVKKAEAEGIFKKVGVDVIEMSNLKELMPEVFTADVMTPKNFMNVVVRDDFPEEIAYKITKILDEHHQEMVDTWGSLKYGTPARHIKYAHSPFELHPGVAKYYKEKGYLK